MLSTEAGDEFFATDTTVPFFTVITLSAMAQRAELCVIITTVIPRSRPVFCKSESMDFPVL